MINQKEHKSASRVHQEPAELDGKLQTSKIVENVGICCKTVHQLDCIYHGEMNKSYQREGFGVLQTIDFDTYFGFWKNNKAEGRGLIFFKDSSVLFAYFYRNSLSGPVIYDNSPFLKICCMQGHEKVGLAFEYHRTTHLWRMIKYFKGSQKIIREEVKPLNEKLPDMIAIEHSLSQFLKDYLNGDYFRQIQMKKTQRKGKKDDKTEDKPSEKYNNLSQKVIQKQGQNIQIGFRNQKYMQGLGCIYNKNKFQLVQAGFYLDGIPQGYTYTGHKTNRFSIDHYVDGVKEGFSFQSEPSNYTISEYYNDKFVRTHNQKQQFFKKKQKSYNFEQKDFLSAHNLFSLNQIKQNVEPNLQNRNFESTLKKQQKQKEEKADESMKKSTFRRSNSPTNQKLTQSHNKNVPEKLRTVVSSVYEQNQKTSLEMIRLKMADYSIQKSQAKALDVTENKRQKLLQYQSHIDQIDFDEEQIAEEENPFDNVMLGVGLILESPPKKFH